MNFHKVLPETGIIRRPSIIKNRAPGWGKGLTIFPALALIRAYQLLLAPLFPSCCRFTPSCSHYAAEAFRRHGLMRGLILSLRRLGRCHPFHPGGWDPVP